MTIPRATFDDLGYCDLHFPYRRALVEALKAEIPADSRDYDPNTKVWTVRPDFAGLAIHLLRTWFPEARVTYPDSPRSGGERPFAVLHLLPTAPPELIDAAYRCLARLHHPDVGGDADTMRALNEARDALRLVTA